MFSLADYLTEPTWKSALRSEFTKPYWLELQTFLEQAYENDTVYPPLENLFQAFSLTPLPNVNAVIVGQDPYHGGQAHGLAFSVKAGFRLPPSLKNIYQAATLQTGSCHSQQGDLSHWAEQGILLLNAVLSVTQGHAGAHQGKGWETFTDKVITTLNEQTRPIAFLLWGNYAKAKAKTIDQSRHAVFESVHPSPFAAHKGFFQNGHFSGLNEFLLNQQRQPIKF